MNGHRGFGPASAASLLLPLVLLLASPARGQTEAAQKIAEGDYHSPIFSPEGTTLLVSDSRMRGLTQIEVRTARATKLSDEARAGVHAHFLADGRVAFQARRAGALRHLAIGPKGVTEIEEAAPLCFAHRDHIYLHTESGLAQVGSGDRFFNPRMSPDKRKVVFEGLATGIHIYDLSTRSLSHLGAGSSPRWAPDSQHLVYERTEDDGHQIVASDLWLWHSGEGSQRLTSTENTLERHPSFSPDGKRIAFDDDQGAIYILPVELAP